MITRAIQLIEHSRYDLAEQELHKVLAQDPEDFFAHAYLGLCRCELEKYEEAKQSARQSIGLEPDHPFGHYVMGVIFMEQNNLKQAKEAFQEALRLDPENSLYYGMLSHIYLVADQHQKALDYADKGLSLDPTDLNCKNCRARALTYLGRSEDAHETIKDALKDNPEDPATFANLGWTCLHNGKHQEALEYFKESLRLDPEREWARQGMIQALKANYLVYKLLLMFYLWMSRLSPKARMGVIIGIFVGAKIVRVVGRENPELMPFLIPFVILYMCFIYLTWTSTHFFNTLLRFNKFGRYVLSNQERKASNCYAILFVSGVLAGITGLVIDQRALMSLAVFLIVMTIPTCHLFNQTNKKSKQITLSFCIALTILGLISIAGNILSLDNVAATFGGLFFLLFIIFTWTGALRSTRSEDV